MIPGFRPLDLIVVGIIALLFFGPKRLPEMGSAIGKTIKEFQKSMREVTHPNEAEVSPPLPAATVQPAQMQPATPVSATASESGRDTMPSANAAPPTSHSSD